jgi:hypothetical protein
MWPPVSQKTNTRTGVSLSGVPHFQADDSAATWVTGACGNVSVDDDDVRQSSFAIPRSCESPIHPSFYAAVIS